MVHFASRSKSNIYFKVRQLTLAGLLLTFNDTFKTSSFAQNQICAPTCYARMWKPACGIKCRSCPAASMDHDSVPQESRSNWTHDIQIICDYQTYYGSQGNDLGSRKNRVEAFAFPMPGELEDVCLTSDINVVYGAWPDGVTNTQCGKDVCQDSSCTCIKRCQEICSQHPDCIYADFSPINLNCRLFKGTGQEVGSVTGHTLSIKNVSSCRTQDGVYITTSPPDTKSTDSTLPTVAETPDPLCEPRCLPHQWKVQCGEDCQWCPASQQDSDEVPQVTRSNYSIPEVPIVCNYTILKDTQGTDGGTIANRVQVFGFQMEGQFQDICLVSDINVEAGSWPSRTKTHQERCMEVCSQFPECGFADLHPLNNDCRLYRCSASKVKSHQGDFVFVKQAGSCTQLPTGVSDGGGCVLTEAPMPAIMHSTSMQPTRLPTSLPSHIPSTHPTILTSPDPSITPNEDFCRNITCVLHCNNGCGWDEVQNICTSDAETSEAEMAMKLGCTSSPNEASTSAPKITDSTTSKLDESSSLNVVHNRKVVTALSVSVSIVAVFLILATVYMRRQCRGGISEEDIFRVEYHHQGGPIQYEQSDM